MDRPIIMRAPQIRALFSGAKTQDRQIIKPQPEIDGRGTFHVCNAYGGCIGVPESDVPSVAADYVPWHVGDRLWAREGFALLPKSCYNLPKIVGPDPDFAAYYRVDFDRSGRPPWRSPTQMPRWASRLTLIVTDVRVRRLQDITEADAIAEGATARPHCSGFGKRDDGWSMDWSRVGQSSKWAADGNILSESDVALDSPVSAFTGFINELHDPKWNFKGDGIFAENPWVTALTFSVHQANIDAMPVPAPQDQMERAS